MKIDLGCGNFIQEGYINHDLIKHRPEIDITFDLNKFPYPIKDNEYEKVRMFDVLEHLNEPLKVIDEIHRILKLNGVLEVKCCGYENPNFWVDITHKKAFDIKSMDYFDPTTELGKEYNYYTDRKWKILSKDYGKHKNIYFKMQKI